MWKAVSWIAKESKRKAPPRSKARNDYYRQLPCRRHVSFLVAVFTLGGKLAPTVATLYNNRWETIKQLGEGGQGHTFLIKDVTAVHQGQFVLKRLKNLERLGRFKSEVAAMLKLNHNDILKVVDHSFEGKYPYIVSEFCSGGSLADMMARKPPSIREAFRLFIKIADAVNYAHSEGVIHRDLKPANIFLRPPTDIPLIGDFGLCYIEESPAGERETEMHEAVGPRLFMAPEWEDGRVDRLEPSGDVYSLGKLLYWLLVGDVFSREKHRNDEWNLGKRLPHAYEPGFNLPMEHITRLLDHMIVEDPRKRARLGDVILSAKRINDLIARAVNPVTPQHSMTCTFCGWGRYQVEHVGNDARNFGLQMVGNPDWRVLVCNECGHVQLFRVDIAKRGNWWTKPSA